MQIEVDVSAFYRSRVLDPGETPPEGAQVTETEFAGQTRQMVRELVQQPSVTFINVPDESLDQMHADHVAAGGEKSRAQVLVRHLEDAVLPKHAPAGHWQGIRASDPELHTALQSWISQHGQDGTNPNPAGEWQFNADGSLKSAVAKADAELAAEGEAAPTAAPTSSGPTGPTSTPVNPAPVSAPTAPASTTTTEATA